MGEGINDWLKDRVKERASNNYEDGSAKMIGGYVVVLEILRARVSGECIPKGHYYIYTYNLNT